VFGTEQVNSIKITAGSFSCQLSTLFQTTNKPITDAVLLEKLTVPQLVKTSRMFCKSKVRYIVKRVR